MESEKTLTPEQIKRWREIIALQIYQKAKSLGISDERASGASVYAHLMPEEEVITFWRKTKAILENPKSYETPKQEEFKPRRVIERKPCQHKNCIKGANGRYCLDCDCYV